ncbi:MAG: hypothetical protein WKF33_12845, partial [Thermoleophilaceae bacterium]
MDAAERAVASPLLETSIDGAHSILLSITGGRDMSLWEVNESARAVSEAAHPDANIIFGAMVDENVVDQVWVTVVATRYGEGPRRAAEPMAGRADEPAPEPVLAGVGASKGAGAGSSRSAHERAGEERSLGPPPSSSAPTEGLGELEVPEFVPRSGRR